MIPATHVIMATHPILVLLPILGFFVVPCVSTHSDNGLRIVSKQTVKKIEECDLSLCPQNETCTKALGYEEKSLCFLLYCAQNKSCENITNIQDLLAEQESDHVEQNKTSGSAPPHQSSGHNASLPSQDGSLNVTQQSILTTDISASRASTPTKPPASSTVVPNKVQTTPLKQVNGSDVPDNFSPTTTPTTRSATSTATTTTTITSNTTATSTTTTTTTTTVITTTDTQQPESKTSASITPLVPTAAPLTTSPKPVRITPVPTSTKPSPTTPKTSTSPSTTPKNISDGAQGRTKVDVAGDPLSIHLLNTSSLLAVLLFGLLFFVVAVALFLKQAYESYKRKDYTQVDYLINGMYSDSGV